MRRKAWLGLIVVLTTTLLGFPGPAPVSADAISGAIFTSKSDGTLVNGNIYASKDDVYLNGGPQPTAPCTAAGLDDGNYVFQVTDPSGAVLLSQDTVNARQFAVSGGKITAYTGTSENITASDHELGSAPCTGAVSIELMPYGNTPNPGGEYKVWITRLSDFLNPVGNCSLLATLAQLADCNGRFGFVSGHTKTDNFKVRVAVTPATGDIVGNKFYDCNTDGTQNDGCAGGTPEPGIQGWNIYLFTGACNPAGTDTPVAATQTDSGGVYEFTGLAPGSYCVVEESDTAANNVTPGAWVHTNAKLGSVTVVVDTVAPGPAFGNVALGPGGGRTLGFWSNRNGFNVMNDGDTVAPELALLSGLNLRDASGTNFDPVTYPTFRSWLLNATAVNMAYMLSAQLAAMELNVEAGFVNGSALIFAGPNPSGCSVPVNAAGFISVNALMGDANTELGADGFTPAGVPGRVCQEFKKNALDAANNNLNFVQAPITAVTSTFDPPDTTRDFDTIDP